MWTMMETLMREQVQIIITDIEYEIEAPVFYDRIIYDDPGWYTLWAYVDHTIKSARLIDRAQVVEDLKEKMSENIKFDIDGVVDDYDINIYEFTWSMFGDSGTSTEVLI